MKLAASHAKTIQVAFCAGEALVCLRLGAAVARAHSVGRVIHVGAADPSDGADHRSDSVSAADLAALTYELLDAHSDTAQLADGLEGDRYWAAHLDYLRALQREGRETLARTASGWLDVR